MRSNIAGILIIVMLLFLFFSLFNLQVIQGGKFRQLSDKNCIRLLPQLGSRGKILDRNGEIIVSNKLSYDVMVLPQEAKKLDAVLLSVSRVLDADFKSLKKAYKAGFVSSSLPVTIKRNIDLKKAIILAEKKLELPSVIIQPNPVRDYPYGKLACHIIGYINEIDHWRLTKLQDYGYNTKDLVGFGGIEEKFDYYLRQEEGGLSFEVNHKGRFVRVLGFRPPKNGKDIQLTIDLNIQKIVEDKLGERNGACIIMNPNTGEIIALASAPSFDPADFVERSASISGLFSDKDAPLMNRAISNTYPPASIFKAIMATAGLETKKINLSTTILCQGQTLVGNRKFACWTTHGEQNIYDALAHSCDIYFYKTGLSLGAQTIYDYAIKFGLAKVTSLELPYEAGGFVPSPLWRKLHKFQNWYDGDTANFSIGQGEVLVTPIQMVRMMAVFANKGYLVSPSIIKSIAGKAVATRQKKNSDLSLKPNTIAIVRKGLRDVVVYPSGTGNVLSTLPVSVAGKTGTAQTSRNSTHAWFAGFFPYEEPKYVICVLLEHGGPGYASTVLAKQIIEEMVNKNLL
ncbi:MAG: penicillin-binding protein 2 [Candidatus Omnitrophica bacterium]|nr:penicillin-binding protein 2 [Candidatus Omnitrophota bacterium]